MGLNHGTGACVSTYRMHQLDQAGKWLAQYFTCYHNQKVVFQLLHIFLKQSKIVPEVCFIIIMYFGYGYLPVRNKSVFFNPSTL